MRAIIIGKKKSCADPLPSIEQGSLLPSTGSYFYRFLAAALVMIVAASQAIALEGLPGSTWGSLTTGSNTVAGAGGMGWINQGIDWIYLPGNIMFNTYAEYRYRAREKNNAYYNAEGPAIGMELKKSFLRIGADYYAERFPKLGQYSYNRELYVTGFYDWDAARLGAPVSRPLPGSVWFNASYDANGLTGSGAMGWINQGIDWITLPGNVVFNTYAEYRYRTRTKQRQYYDAEGPAIGLELRRQGLHLGADYYWENDPALPKRTDYVELYFIWYLDWDLMRTKH